MNHLIIELEPGQTVSIIGSDLFTQANPFEVRVHSLALPDLEPYDGPFPPPPKIPEDLRPSAEELASGDLPF